MDPTTTITPKSQRRHLRDVVESYLKNRIPRDLHPSYEAIDNDVAAKSRPILPPYSRTEPLLKISEQHGDTAAEPEDEEEISLDEIYQDAEIENRRFVSAMEQYERNADAKYKTHIATKGFHTWEQVLEEVDNAANQYKDASTFWGKLRQGFRKFGINNDALTAWIDLLPSQSQYFSIICGGLKLILGAAARLKDLRNNICEALAQIPALLTNTRLINGVFKSSKELHKCSAALYVNTLIVLEHIITWYRQKSAKKLFKVFFKQDTYEESLMDKMRSMELSSVAFAEAAKICSYQRQERVLREIQVHRKETRESRGIMERSFSESARRSDGMQNVVRAEAIGIRQGVSEMDQKLVKLEATNVGLQGMVENLLKCFLSGNERINPKTNDVREPVLPENKLASKFARLRKQRIRMQEEALVILNYEESIPQGDIEAILRIAWILPRPAQDRAVSLMQSPKLHAWITETDSSVLLINGNYNGSARQSPLSFVCAKLVDSIQPTLQEDQPKNPAIFAHAFFCGQHLDSKDPDTGLDGLMRSLIAQLLVAYPKFDYSTVQRLRHINPDSVRSLCEIFFVLVMQIPTETMVFCMIDGITFYESSPTRLKDAHKVVQTLVDVSRSCGENGCIFKVLLTSPGNSRAVYKELDKADVIWMPRKVASQGGFTSMKWNATAGRDVRELTAA